MHNALKNWVLPIVSILTFVILGVIVIGLPGFEMVVTLDGIPVQGELSAKQIDAVVDGENIISSHLNFYGVRLFGRPIYWHIGIICVCGIMGYKFASKFRAKKSD
ncbi:hypothetical protein [Sneathiella aquimaris]|uniref:hypothetical protein n=1 Tax=Sneathiella aquimaris TaxID=2599305 RepID=UPI00146F87BF|nr:hypothetical protein [Sneathiella aquimaris]